MTLNVDAAQIEAQISQDIQACELLLSLLAQEQDALKNREPDALAEIIEAKIPPLSHLEQSAQVRASWLQAAGQETTAEAWLKMLSNSEQLSLKENWYKLKTLMTECRLKNEVNGKLLVRNQQVFGRLLDLLRGQNTSANLYTASGAAKGYSGSNIVGEA